jgi:PGF-pre-PGF domain-containing protein
MKEGRSGRVRYALALGVLLSMVFVSIGSGADLTVDPNVTGYVANRTFNFTVNNTDPTMNLTGVWLFLNSSFVYVDATNGTSADSSDFSNETSYAAWINSTAGGLVENGTTQWFWLNLTVPQTAGNYSFIANLTYANGTNETKTFNITLNCSQELVAEIFLPSGGGYLYGGPVPFYGRVLDACGNLVTGADVIYSIYKNPNMYNRTNTNPTHNSTGQWSEASGWYNFTWSGTDAERTVGWYNVTFYVSRAGYPDNYSFSEDAFHMGYQPSLSATSVERTSTCPESHHFNVTVNDADNDYNNVTLEIRRWDDGWGSWEVANWTYQNGLITQNIDFYQNFSNTSFLAGLYSYRFNSSDEYGYNGSVSGSVNFTINNCTDVLSIGLAPPSLSNGSYSNSSNLTINITFTSANAVNCTLEFNNGTASNFTDDASKGWCNFTILNQTEGVNNYSVWVNNTYGNVSWNGTWSIGIDLTDPDGLNFSSNTTTNSTSPLRQDWFFVNVTFNDTNPSHCILKVDNGTATNYTMAGTQTKNCSLNVTGLPTSNYNYSVYAFDLSGRFAWNGTSYVNLDTTPPNISVNILNLSESSVFYNQTSLPSNLQVMTSEAASLCWFNINGTNGTSMSNSSQTSWSSPMSIQYNGTYVLNISCNDTVGNLNATNVTFNYDNTTPPCTENWVYGEWGLCLGGVQYRTATDLNSCGTTDNRSYLSQGCGAGGGGGGGGAVIPLSNTTETKVWGAVLMDSYLTMAVTKNAISLTSIGFQTTNSLTAISIKVESLTEIDDGINLTEGRKLYQYINITPTNIPQESIKNVTMDFCVDYEWLNENSVSKDTIKMKRLYRGTWQALITRKVSDDGEEACYESETPGFSYFAITGDVVLTEQPHKEYNATGNETVPAESETHDRPTLPMGSVCHPGERACVGWNVLQECNGDGTGWVTVTDCFYGCSNAQCNTQLVISIDYNLFWAVIGMVAVLLVIWVVHSKKREIEDFLFWHL